MRAESAIVLSKGFTKSAATNVPDNHREEFLRRGLERWREKRLADIEQEIQQQNYIYGRAEFGLKSAHETPGVFDEDFVQDLWDDLNSAATELARLDKESERLRAMNLPELLLYFKHNRPQPASAPPHNGPAPATDVDAAVNPSEPGEKNQQTSTDQDYHGQAQDIVKAWREIMGMELDPQRVEEHLKSLERWERRWRKHG